MTAIEPAERLRKERATWARGDYGAIARTMFWPVGERIVRRTGVGPGDRVLDVACGTGNAAIRAAQTGAEVVALDLTPELLEAGRELAGREGVEVTWVEGDAEALPFADRSFDVVLSTFGCMFAPAHERTAAELARVLRRGGGRLGVCSWTPQSSLAELMRTLFAHLPPDDGAGPPPPLWGDEQHVHGLFEGSGIALEPERETVEFHAPSLEHALSTYETLWGPFVEAREALGPRWAALRAELGAVLERRNTAAGGGLRYEGEYLAVAGTRA
jgi:SAM-dependent methyltransferase